MTEGYHFFDPIDGELLHVDGTDAALVVTGLVLLESELACSAHRAEQGGQLESAESDRLRLARATALRRQIIQADRVVLDALEL